MDIAIKKKELIYSAPTSCITLAFTSIILVVKISSLAISPILSLLVYRTVSPSPPIYEIIISKTYLIIDDLYIRYVSLKYVKSIKPISHIIRPTIILFIITIKDLYEKFHNKAIKWIFKSSIMRIAKDSIN